LLGLNAAAQEKPGAVLQKKLEARYKGQQVSVVPAGVFVGIADLKGPSFFITDHDFSVHYDHFADGVECRSDISSAITSMSGLPRKSKRQPSSMSTTEAGETLEVVKLQMLRKGQQYMVDVLLRALASRHLSVRAIQAHGATIVAKNDIGVHFRFYFPSEVAEQGDYDKMVQEIDRYLVRREAPFRSRRAGDRGGARTCVNVRRRLVSGRPSKSDCVNALAGSAYRRTC
jgi:hypothetical protein